MDISAAAIRIIIRTTQLSTRKVKGIFSTRVLVYILTSWNCHWLFLPLVCCSGHLFHLKFWGRTYSNLVKSENVVMESNILYGTVDLVLMHNDSFEQSDFIQLAFFISYVSNCMAYAFCNCNNAVYV